MLHGYIDHIPSFIAIQALELPNPNHTLYSTVCPLVRMPSGPHQLEIIFVHLIPGHRLLVMLCYVMLSFVNPSY